jgi:hypothetical protein
MRSRSSLIVASLVLLVCLICPLVEIMDQWDNTLQTGNDTEYALVVAALCLGAALLLAKVVLPGPQRKSRISFAATEGTSLDLLWFLPLGLMWASPPFHKLRI